MQVSKFLIFSFAHSPCVLKRLSAKEEVVLEGIARVKAYMSSIGLPTTKEELGVKEEDIPQLANIQCGGFVPLGQKEIMEIYQLMV